MRTSTIHHQHVADSDSLKLTERMPSTDKSHGLAVVHAHAPKHVTDVGSAAGGVGNTLGPLRIDWGDMGEVGEFRREQQQWL